MNTPSPLVPQGSLIGRPGRSHIRIAVFTILAIHIVLLGALLLQGCKRTAEPEPPAVSQTTNISFSEFTPPPLPPLNTVTSRTPILPPPVTPTTPPALPPEIPEELPPSVVTTEPPAVPEPSSPPPESPSILPSDSAPPARSGVEHTVKAGDTFYELAVKYNTTSKAIANANPNVDPRRLKVGTKLYIPPPAPTAPAPAETVAAQGQTIHTVKSGDTLSKLARDYKTTIKALRSANNLTTDRIIVGQKLIIPKSQTP